MHLDLNQRVSFAEASMKAMKTRMLCQQTSGSVTVFMEWDRIQTRYFDVDVLDLVIQSVQGCTV